MIYLRQSTASQEIPLGRFVDSTDGNTQETALTIANTDIKLWKAGATTLANKNSGGATHIANGEYYAVLDATDTDTIGPMKVSVHVAGALAVQVWCCVLDEAVYDVMFGTTALATTTNITAAAGIAVSSIGNNVITAASINADAITAAKIADGAIDAATFAAGAINAAAIAADAITAAKIADGAIDAATFAAGAITAAAIAADAITDAKVAADVTIASVTGAVGSVTATVTANTIQISGSTTAADNLEAGALGLVSSTCAAGSTTTSVVTNLTEATDDHYNGRVITFTSGALAGQSSSVSDYNGTTKALTVVALTEAPANTDSFVIS